MISGYNCGIKDIFILLEFLVADVSGHPPVTSSMVQQSCPKTSVIIKKMLCNIPEEQRFQPQNLS